jgi:hypothetical protein
MGRFEWEGVNVKVPSGCPVPADLAGALVSALRALTTAHNVSLSHACRDGRKQGVGARSGVRALGLEE